jgi:GNAT superfamily N-acetyltransferase
MELKIRRARTREDALTTLSLIEQLADFEQLSPPDADAQSRFMSDGFEREPPRFEVWLAERDGLTIGYALLFETYSSFLCRPTIYLEDLYVVPEYRGRGIGGALLDHCRSLAVERGCGRMEWTCLDWNVKAQKVYEGLGAEKMSKWLLYRLTSDKL